MPTELSTPSVSLEDLLDLLPLGACVIDEHRIVHAWNSTLVAWTDIAKDRAIGMNLAEQFPRLSAWCFRDRLTQVFVSGTPTVFSAAFHKYFIPVTWQQGASNTPMIQQTIVRPLGDAGEHALILIQDVTVQYLQMEDLRTQRRRLQDATSQDEAMPAD